MVGPGGCHLQSATTTREELSRRVNSAADEMWVTFDMSGGEAVDVGVLSV